MIQTSTVFVSSGTPVYSMQYPCIAGFGAGFTDYSVVIAAVSTEVDMWQITSAGEIE